MKKLYTHRSIYLLFAVCWVCYFCTYLGRLNFTACIAEINTAEHISKLKLGQISSAFFVCYGFGQLFSGFLADRLCAKRLVGLGLLGSAILNWGMALCHTPDMMVLIWALNGLFQSMAWAPLVRTVADLVPGPQCARICLNLATTTPVGTLAAYGICVICISLGNWQRAFWTGGLFLTVAGVLWLAAITALERLAHRDGIEDVLAQGNVRSTLPEKKSTQQLVLTLAPVCLAACIHGLLKDGIMTWVPSFLQEKFSLLTAFSVSLTMLLPLVNLSGVYIGNAVNVRRFRNEASTACLFFGVCGAGLLLWLFWGKESLRITFAVLLFSTTCLTSVSTMLLSLLPLRFRRQGQTATVTGILNAVTYAGSALSSIGFGALSTRWGWNAVFLAWCADAALGAVACLFGRRCGHKSGAEESVAACTGGGSTDVSEENG